MVDVGQRLAQIIGILLEFFSHLDWEPLCDVIGDLSSTMAIENRENSASLVASHLVDDAVGCVVSESVNLLSSMPGRKRVFRSSSYAYSRTLEA